MTAACFCLIPLLPDIFAPFLMPVPFFACLLSTDGRKRLATVLGRVNPALVWAIIYLFSCFLGIAVSSQIVSTNLTCILWLFCIMSFVSTGAVIESENDLNICLVGLASGLGGVSVIALVQALVCAVTGNDIWPIWTGFEAQIIAALPDISVDLSFHGLRSTASFANSNVLGLYIVMVIPIVFYFFSRVESIKGKVLTFILVGLSIGALSVTYSRMSYVGFILLIFFLLISYCVIHFRRKRLRFRVLIGFSMALIIPVGILIISLAMPRVVVGRFMDTFKMDDSIFGRFEVWLFCLGKIIDEPMKLITGMGTGAQNIWNMIRGWGFDLPHCHNLYLQLLLESGFIRLVSFMGWVISMIKQMSSAVTSSPSKGKYFMISMISFLFAVLLEGFTDYIFVDPKICWLFCAVSGIMLSFPNFKFPHAKIQASSEKI